PNAILPAAASEERTRLLTDPRLPLYNRAIQALYPPGSTFKIISSLAMLEQHVMSVDQTVHCTGSYTIGAEKRILHCWKLTGHGYVDFQKAVEDSCDVYFYQVGLKLGANVIEQY